MFRPFLSYHFYKLCALVTAIICQIVMVYFQFDALWHHPVDFYFSLDPDVSLRLTLIRDLLHHSDLMDHTIPRMDAPYGTDTPWTRPVDGIVIALALPLFSLFSTEQSLLVAALIYGPVLACISIGILLRITRQLALPAMASLLITLGFLTYPATVSYFKPGNIDHHSLLVTLYIAALYLAIKLTDKSNLIIVGCLGIIIGVGIWISVEFQLVAALLFGWFGWMWCLHSEKRWADILSVSALVASVVTFLALLIEHPSTLYDKILYDTVSIVHIVTLFATGIAASCLGRFSFLRTSSRRFALCLLVAATLFGLLIWLFPRFYLGPLADVNPELDRALHGIISEMQPLYLKGLGLAYTFYSFFALIVIFSLRKMLAYSPILLLLLIGNIVFLILSLMAVRISYYLLPVSLLLLAYLITELYRPIEGYRLKRQELAFVFAALFPIFAVSYMDTFGIDPEQWWKGEPAKEESFYRCKYDLIRKVESGDFEKNLGAEPLTIATASDWGTYLLWRTPHHIIASNYQRDDTAFFALQTIVKGDQPATGNMLLERKVDLLILCDTSRIEMKLLDKLRTEKPAWAILVKELSLEESPLYIYRIDHRLLPSFLGKPL